MNQRYVAAALTLLAVTVAFFSPMPAQAVVVVAVHGIGTFAPGWSRPYFDDWARNIGGDTKGRYREEEITYEHANDYTRIDHLRDCTPWVDHVSSELMRIHREHPQDRLVIVSHSFGTVAALISLTGGSCSDKTYEPLDLPPYFVDLITLASPLGSTGRLFVPAVQVDVRRKPTSVARWYNFYHSGDILWDKEFGLIGSGQEGENPDFPAAANYKVDDDDWVSVQMLSATRSLLTSKEAVLNALRAAANYKADDDLWAHLRVMPTTPSMVAAHEAVWHASQVVERIEAAAKPWVFFRGQKIPDLVYWNWASGSGLDPYETEVCAPAGRTETYGECNRTNAAARLAQLLDLNQGADALPKVLFAHRDNAQINLPGGRTQDRALGDLPDVSPFISIAKTESLVTKTQNYFPHKQQPDDCYGMLIKITVESDVVFPEGASWPTDRRTVDEVVRRFQVFPLNTARMASYAVGEAVFLFAIDRAAVRYDVVNKETPGRSTRGGGPEVDPVMLRTCPETITALVSVEVD